MTDAVQQVLKKTLCQKARSLREAYVWALSVQKESKTSVESNEGVKEWMQEVMCQFNDRKMLGAKCQALKDGGRHKHIIKDLMSKGWNHPASASAQ